MITLRNRPLALTLALFSAFISVAHAAEDVHSVGILEDGFDALLVRLHLVRNAQHTVDVQTFIWKNDVSGHAFMDECVAAARRGVKVCFLTDHLYSDADMDTALALARVHPNLSINRYRPPHDRLRVSFRKTAAHSVLAFRSRNQRMHNKSLIVDGKAAIVGGRNISDAYFNQSESFNYLDRDVLITGPLVAEIAESFEEYWEFDRSVALEELRDVRNALSRGETGHWAAAAPGYAEFRDRLDGRLQDVDARIDEMMHPVESARLTVDPPGKNEATGFMSLWGSSDTARNLLEILGDAEERVLIETPYLIVDRRSARFIRRMRKARPDLAIDVITDSYATTGNMAAYAGTFRSRARARSLGFTVYELKPHPESGAELLPRDTVLTGADVDAGYVSIYAKSLVVDGRVSYVGSFNLDPRSIHLNTEIGVIVDDAEFAERLAARIEVLLEPGNSWVEAERDIPLAGLNRKMEWISRRLPLDVWPVSSTVLVDQETGEVIGVLPVNDFWSKKRWMFRLNRAVGFLVRPIL